MDPLGGMDLLSQHRDIIVRRNNGIERIDTVPWAIGCMRTDSPVDGDKIVAGYGCTTPNSADVVGRELLLGNGMPADVSLLAPATWGTTDGSIHHQ